jgi:uncharacterized protein (TIGR02284 family)
MTTTTDDTIDILNNLIETSKDGEYGFRSSAENIESNEIKQLFIERAEECRQAAADLQAMVVQLGGTPDEGGSASGAMHRGWVSVKGTLTGHSDKAVLEETERGEDTALASYRKALSADLPLEVRSLVERQMQGVQRNHDQVRALRDRARTVER